MEAETKHTPAPWCVGSAQPIGGAREVFEEKTGRTVAMVWPPEYGAKTGNAALVALAPEMLAELRQAELALRHAAQESAGRVRREIVDGWILRASSIRDLIYNATDEAIDASGMPI
jgi:hypothetical protein